METRVRSSGSAPASYAQAIHHANEHRAHVCTILGALGHEPPDVSAWGYADATGRRLAEIH